MKRDVYVANISEAGPGFASVTFREEQPKAEDGQPPRAADPAMRGGGPRDINLVMSEKDVPKWGGRFTLELKERKG